MNLKKYEIVFITREHKDLPGARYRAFNFATHLQKIGYNAYFLSYHNNLGAFSGKLETYLKFRDKIYYNWKAYNYLKRFKNPLLIINRLNYHSFGPLFYALRKGLKYIYDLDDWEFRENIRYLAGLWPSSKAEFISRLATRNAYLCFAGSFYLFNYLKKFNPKTFYLPPGIDLSNYRPKNSFYNKQKTLLTWIGTMFRKEDYINLKFILKIMLNLKYKTDAVLEIVGDGLWKDKLEEEVKKLRLENIRFKGWIPQDKIPVYLDNVDIGLCPIVEANKFTQAKFPVKVLEYMAKAIPVVASNFGEISNIIDNNEDGFLVKSETEFTDKILTLINNLSLREFMGLNARRKIEKKYEIGKQTEEFISILENA